MPEPVPRLGCPVGERVHSAFIVRTKTKEAACVVASCICPSGPLTFPKTRSRPGVALLIGSVSVERVQ
jgi:hypothetical protein